MRLALAFHAATLPNRLLVSWRRPPLLSSATVLSQILRTEIETWRREYNEVRPKKALCGLTPSAYARQLATKANTIKPGLQIRTLPKAGDVGPRCCECRQ